ncbi:MAG: hypothetical protein E7463_15470 [Ruminococcaceae bacterium]|nr:hypothetical protein [Oscillospiraceae bacterium]
MRLLRGSAGVLFVYGAVDMSSDQRKRAQMLREEGRSYAEIAHAMKVPVGTVKSWLHRVQGGKKDNCTPGICLRCGKRFPVVEGRKLKKFCSDSCRISWWSSNRDRINRKAEVCSVCRVCGRTYMSYPSQGKIYCSRRCYFEDRYGKDTGKHD